MIRSINRTDVITLDVENLVVAILKGIEISDKMSANYTLEISRDDVAVLAKEIKKITNVEVS